MATDFEKSSHESFTTAFEKATHEIQLGGEKVNYTLMHAQGVHKDAAPVCLIPGLGFLHSSYKKSLERIYNDGLSFCAFGYVQADISELSFRKQNERNNMQAQIDQWVTSGEFTQEQTARALGVLAIIEKVPLKTPIHMITHSAGDIHVLLAAALRPNLFSFLGLYAPAGMIANDTGDALWGRSINFFKELMKHARKFDASSPSAQHAGDFIRESDQDFLSFYTHHMREGTFRDQLHDVAKVNALPLVTSLRQKGINIKVYLGGIDHVFPHHLIEPQLKERGIPYYAFEHAGHLGVGSRPEVIDAIARDVAAFISSAAKTSNTKE